MKSPILVDVKFDTTRKYDSFEQSLKERVIYNLNKGDEPDDYRKIKYALVWKPDAELLEKLTGLEVLFSAGAGVDHIFESGAKINAPIVRFVDPSLTTRMSEWVCLQCLSHLRQTHSYAANQKNKEWKELPQPQAGEVSVGIMGLGQLGLDAAQKLSMLGFKVNGWSRSKKTLEGIECFDENEMDDFLEATNILVGLLPLTDQTKGIFNRGLFDKLKKHEEIPSPIFINAGRGGSQVKSDIIECIQEGTLGGASLDVFEEEPLPETSRLWEFENVVITPHISAISDISALGAYVEKQIARYEAGKPLDNLVDQSRGY